ncbi:hypothetical protein GON01_02230 [Sphingomonas sp. MAH-20]|jgi:hypothetical protein|uniref:Uncharacterized protein n=1 Tax=Sphingomonas horti TaxID=2682842 RepID=A0A6I4IX99_9SPHN|nr:MULTISPECIES: hypothetical protein [Sphingomonas]MBA2920507.1 hypothetical protein [Sphingomonas sp. CGMCC 1.13658]MVO76759.1 hypothetical protein [Sphingomonas horti]
MSYAQKPTWSEELQGRLGDAVGRWARGLVSSVSLTWKLSADVLRRALLKPRTVRILEIPAGKDGMRPARMSVIPKADAWLRENEAGRVPPLPLP